jgi:hypothetical protein
MRTTIIILAGLVLLGVSLLVARWMGGAGTKTVATVAIIFIPVWLGAALINLWMGVSRAGYSVTEELPIFLVIFAIPAAVARLVWWKSS